MTPRVGFLAAGLAASAAVSAAFWLAGVPGFFLFLLAPLAMPWWRRPARRCPACGFASSSPDARFCPRDATPLS